MFGQAGCVGVNMWESLRGMGKATPEEVIKFWIEWEGGVKCLGGGNANISFCCQLLSSLSSKNHGALK